MTDACAKREIMLSTAKANLKNQEAKLRVAGLDGSNKDAREAQLRNKLVEQHNNTEAQINLTIQIRADVEIAKLEVRRLEWTIRLLELNTHTT